jgi:hypothetical protein
MQRRGELKEEIVHIIANTADIDDQIAVARENLRELNEQAAAYSGAADDDLVVQRIADQEARLELLTKRREEVLQSTKSNATQNLMRGEETWRKVGSRRIWR